MLTFLAVIVHDTALVLASMRTTTPTVRSTKVAVADACRATSLTAEKDRLGMVRWGMGVTSPWTCGGKKVDT
jgi:hypothetical protein